MTFALKVGYSKQLAKKTSTFLNAPCGFVGFSLLRILCPPFPFPAPALTCPSVVGTHSCDFAFEHLRASPIQTQRFGTTDKSHVSRPCQQDFGSAVGRLRQGESGQEEENS